MDVTGSMDLAGARAHVAALEDLASKMVQEKAALDATVARMATEFAMAAVVDLATRTGVDVPGLEPSEHETKRVADDVWRKIKPDVDSAFWKVAAAHEGAAVEPGKLETGVIDAMNRCRREILALIRQG